MIRLVQDILSENAAKRRDKVALVCEKRRLTYGQIDEMSNRLANAFRRHGVTDGDRVLLYLMNSAELVVSIFAVLKANAVFSVIDYANTYETLRDIAADCQATALVTHDHQAEAAARLMDEIPVLRFAVLAGDRAKGPAAGILSFEAIQAGCSPEVLPQRRIDCDLAYLTYTSGSTGKCKGVMVTHRTSLFTINSGIEYLGLSEGDIHTSPLPLSFTMGINQLFKTFRAGGTLILERSFAYPAMTLRRMEAERATGFAGVPTVFALLLQTAPRRHELSRLRFMICMGAALAPSILRQIRERFPQTSFFSAYGMAEAAFSLGLEPEQIDQRPTSVGKPTPGSEAWVSGENGERLGPDQVGELVVRGGHVRSGYWNDPAASARRFRAGPLPGELVCHTGDMFRMDKEGYFYFVARSDETIKTGGKKVVPTEVENALYGLEGVLEAAAVGVPDPLLGQVIKARVVLKEQARDILSVEDILRHCSRTLAAYKVPRQVQIEESLPKTPSGKINKTDLL